MTSRKSEQSGRDSEVWTSSARASILRDHAEENGIASMEETHTLLEAAQLGPGLDVLDLACGSGDPTLELARRVTGRGHVTGVDVSEGALEVGRERAMRAQLSNITFTCANVESMPFAAGSFDRAVSRFGFMYFGDVPRSLGEVRRVLRPGARLAVMVWGSFDQPQFEVTVGVLLHHLGKTALPEDQAAPFRFGTPGSLEGALEDAHFGGIEGRTHHPRWVWKGTPEQARDAWTSGAVYNRPLIQALSDEARPRAWREMADGFRRFYDGECVRVPLTVRVVTAVR